MQLLKSSIYLHTLTIKVSLSDKNDRTTVGFVQVRLEVVAIITNNIAAFVQAGQTLPNIASKYLSLVKSRAVVSGGRNSNATPAQSPNVGRN